MPSCPGMKYGVTISNSDCTAIAASATGRCISMPTIEPFSTRFLSGLSQTTCARAQTSGNLPEIIPASGSPVAMRLA